MAGIPGKGGVKGRSGPRDNMNAFKHGLAAIQKRREEGIPTEQEESVRQQILDGLIADKGGSTDMVIQLGSYREGQPPGYPLESIPFTPRALYFPSSYLAI
jgi:hypothetical protein